MWMYDRQLCELQIAFILNVWNFANVREDIKTSKSFCTVLDLSYVNMFFSRFIQCFTIPVCNIIFRP